MQTDIYKLDRVITTPNCTVRIYRPELDDAERERRMKRIYSAAVNLLKSVHT